MVSGGALVATPVVSGQTGHKLLQVRRRKGFGVGEEFQRHSAAKYRCCPAAMEDDHLAAFAQIKTEAKIAGIRCHLGSSSLPQPAEHFAQRRFFAVHEDSQPENLAGDETEIPTGEIQKPERDSDLPPSDVGKHQPDRQHYR